MSGVFRSGVCMLACGVLLSCANGEPMQEPNNKLESKASVEPLIGAKVGKNQLFVRVASRGCTKKEHFDVKVEKVQQRYHITFMRLKPDYCKAFVSNGIELAYSFEELMLDAGSAILLQNPFSK